MTLGRKQNRSASAKPKTPPFTLYRAMGYDLPGIHNLNAKGQYDASGAVGRNDPCPGKYGTGPCGKKWKRCACTPPPPPPAPEPAPEPAPVAEGTASE